MILNNIYALDNENRRYELKVIEESNVITAILPKENIARGAICVDITSDAFNSKAGDKGYYLMPTGLCYFKNKDDAVMCTDRIPLKLFGVKKEGLVVACIAVGMKLDCMPLAVLKGNNYTLSARFMLDGDEPYEDLSVEFHILDNDADYNDMAKLYREYQIENGNCIPIKKRMKGRPILQYAKDSAEIRIRMGWKPAPSAIEDQTTQNEPDMHVACTFDRVKDLVDELSKQGVDQAELCLVGWNKSGHDGRWPSAFPVEPKLGGEEKLKELTSYAKSKGYLIVCHTNSTDAYHISEYWDKDVVAHNKDGSINRSAGIWSGGKAAVVCPVKAAKIAEEIIPKIGELGFYGIHYVDVMAVVPLRKCYSKDHPANRKEALSAYEEIMRLCHENVGGFSSEGVYDFTSKYLDYGLYVKNDAPKSSLEDVTIPFWQLVYHGMILSNYSTGTINYTIKEKEQELLFEESGSRLSFYIYSKFLSNSSANWLGKEDLILDSDDDLSYTVNKIKEGYDQYKKVRHLQTEFMERFEVLDENITMVSYSDGTKCITNHREVPFNLEGILVDPMSFKYIK
ncbi:MAG: DUF5696 domain-containing protein [Bacillota bacterium]|nr:DUF5696 domain-containing protein [Bacillota bacterium]